MARQYLFEAETLCKKYVRERPGQESFLILFLGRQGRIEDALRLLESVWADSDPAVTAAAAMRLLASPAATPQQLKRVEDIVRDALLKFDRPAALLLVMAQACVAQERYRDAEALYREVTDRSSSEYRAMNNLAVLLALQGIKLDEALQLVNRAIDFTGPAAAILDSRATVYLALGKPHQALEDLEKAIAQERTPVRLFHQAQAYYQDNQKQAAIDAMRQAQQLGLEPGMLETLELPAYRGLLRLIE